MTGPPRVVDAMTGTLGAPDHSAVTPGNDTFTRPPPQGSCEGRKLGGDGCFGSESWVRSRRMTPTVSWCRSAVRGRCGCSRCCWYTPTGRYRWIGCVMRYGAENVRA